MTNICDYCLNYESESEDAIKSEQTCSQACMSFDQNENEMVCENFALVICPIISSAVIERFLKKNVDFYDSLCDLASLILTIFSYQNVFKIIFDIENGSVELINMTGSESSYGKFKIKSIQLQQGLVSFEAEPDCKNIIFSVIDPDSLVFVDFEDFDHEFPIQGTFAKPNRFFNKDRISLFMQGRDWYGEGE